MAGHDLAQARKSMTDHLSLAPARDSGRIALADSILGSARCVQAVVAGQSLSDCLAQTRAALRPSVQAISFHVMRRLGFARAARSQLVKRAPSDPLLDALLLVSLALLETALDVGEHRKTAEPKDPSQALPQDKPRDTKHDTPRDTSGFRRDLPVYDVHTVVDQAVSALQGKLKPFRGLVNGTLRNYIRQRDHLRPVLAKNVEAIWNYPRWWIDEIKKAYPDQWQDVLDAGNRPGPMTLRVNQRRASVARVLALFEHVGVAAVPLQDDAIMLPDPGPVHALPGFQEGWWSVQDLAAQRAGRLLPVDSGMRVLDACAAPGGKTAHLLEQADVRMVALDADPVRLKRVVENLERLGLNGPDVDLQCADAADLKAWWDGVPFDAILADVPCTASGVVRRHPDIRWLRRKADIQRTSALQRTIIDALWQTLSPGGHLLFVTCSIFPQEGEQQAQAFCKRHHDARRLPAPGQVLPLQHADGQDTGDGFFYALFVKLASSESNSV